MVVHVIAANVAGPSRGVIGGASGVISIIQTTGGADRPAHRLLTIAVAFSICRSANHQGGGGGRRGG